MYAESTGDCTLDGTTYEISTFKDAGFRDKYLEAAGVEALVGENWIVWNSAGADLSAFHKDLGGEIR